jgi:hypothetical protein
MAAVENPETAMVSAMSARKRLTSLVTGAGLIAAAAGPLSLAGQALLPHGLPGAKAQGTPSLMEFRWDSDKDYRKLYFFMTETGRNKRSDYYLVLKPKDRKTAMLKLTIKLPSYWDAELNPKLMKLCKMSEGGMMSRTVCDKTIPATVEVSPNGKVIEVFPETPVPDNSTIGLFFTTINPFNAGMYQFNALIQPPGDIPVSTYVGSWLIQIDPG